MTAKSDISPTDERPIWEVAEEIAASVPEHEWDDVPRDLATNLDDYLYGELLA
jgi:hypothetical protein